MNLDGLMHPSDGSPFCEAIQVYDPNVASIVEDKVGACKKKIKVWRKVGSVMVDEVAMADAIATSGSLRAGARSWLKGEDLTQKVQPFSGSSRLAKPSVVFKCKLCLTNACSLEWQFHIESGSKVTVETVGSCGGPRNCALAKFINAKKYSQYTHLVAVQLMGSAGISENDMPEPWRHSNHRPSKSDVDRYPVHIEASCLDALKTFLKSPGPLIKVFSDHVVAEEHRIRVPFAAQTCLDAAKGFQLQAFVMDFSHKTNER